MKNEHDPILESALEEALGCKQPPDLIVDTLAKAGADGAATPTQSSAGPRPAWRAWGSGLAAAAAVVITVGLVSVLAISRNADTPQVATSAKANEQPEATDESNDEQFLIQPNALAEFEVQSDSGESMVVTSSSGSYGDDPLVLKTVSTGVNEDPSNDRSSEKGPDGMKFEGSGSNPFVDTEDDKLSTFALEHDTGSYAVVRNYLNGDKLPPDDAVRVEEFVNYFDYDYVKPAVDPFSITMDAAPSRYGQDLANSYLMRVGVQAREVFPAERKPAVLTFVIDTSGSMSGDDRLGLVKRALELLVNELNEYDLVGIAVYGDRGYQHMGYKDASRKSEILESINALETGGSTNAEEGLKVAYQMASAAYMPGAINRVILCSDGVANVGATQTDEILKTIIENRRNGITLSTVGFGMGSYNDNLMEQLGDKGDGHYAYVDSIDEARRVFVHNLTGTLEVVARDVKVQIEFNPEVVKSYRLIGYVNRDIKDEDFRNDNVDGGEIGAGHAGTALYELKLHQGRSGSIGVTTIRYKEDERDEFKEISREVLTRDVAQSWEMAPAGLRLAGNVAEFAEILGESFYAKYAELGPVIEDLEGIQYEYRNEKFEELLKLIKKANVLRD